MTVQTDDHPLRPTTSEVAALVRSHVVPEASTDDGTLTDFTEDTTPTPDDVEVLINQALEAVLHQPTAIKTRHNVALYAAMLVLASFFNKGIDDGELSVYRDLLARNGIVIRTEFEPVNIPFGPTRLA